jgi:hypothetical protein
MFIMLWPKLHGGRTSCDVANIQHHRNVLSAVANITGIVEHPKTWPTSNITEMFFQIWPTSQSNVEHPKKWPTSNITGMFFQLWPTSQEIVEHHQKWPTSNITAMFFQIWPTSWGIVEHPKTWPAWGQHPTSQECSFSFGQQHRESQNILRCGQHTTSQKCSFSCDKHHKES